MARGDDIEQGGSSGGPPRRPLARWRKVSLAVAIVVMLVGVGLWAYAALTTTGAPAAPARTSSPSALAPHSLAPMDAPASETTDAAPSSIAVWSPAIFRLGFSFVAAFCMAYALRTFARIVVIAVGSALLMLVALQYAGLIEVRWDVMEERYTNLSSWLSAQTSTFTALITGYLPSAASAGAGFIAGFTRR
jgi:uncharacterized membrane protein (Fun14 family)